MLIIKGSFQLKISNLSTSRAYQMMCNFGMIKTFLTTFFNIL